MNLLRKAGSRLLPAAVAAALTILLAAVLRFQPAFDQPIVFDGGPVRMSDFTYHIILVRAFWRGAVSTVYTLDQQLAALTQVCGRPMQAAMPVGMSPAILLVWLPFSLLAEYTLPWAAALWSALSVVFFAAAVISWCRMGGRAAPWPIVLSIIALSSTLVIRTAALGQTSLMAAAVLLVLAADLQNAGARFDGRSAARRSMFIVLLMIKPMYALFGVLMLAGSGRFKDLAAACLAAALLMAGFTAVLGLHWPADYLAQLAVYFSLPLPPHYSSSIDLCTTSTITGILCREGPELFSFYPASAWIMNAGIAAGAIFAALRALFSRFSALPPFLPAFAALFAYELFSPYAGAFEDLLLMVPGLILFHRRPRIVAGAAAAAALWVLFNYRSMAGPAWYGFAAKVIFALSAALASPSVAVQAASAVRQNN